MPKPKIMALVDSCRSPARRQIMILAAEAQESGRVLTAKGAAERLNKHLSATSYHVKALSEIGALKIVGQEQRRGALQKHYLPSEAFQAAMTDTVALDQIAELSDGKAFGAAAFLEMKKILRATGRPVGA